VPGRSATTTTPVVGLPFPEDHTAPDTPLDTLFERLLEAEDPYGAVSTERLRGSEIPGMFREEELVFARGNTRPTLVDVVHWYFLCLPDTSGGSEGQWNQRTSGRGRDERELVSLAP
jgi:hypothetical protein